MNPLNINQEYNLFFLSYFGSRNRTKKGRNFPEVTGQDLKGERKRNPGFKEDVCKHVRKSLPGVELIGLGSSGKERGTYRVTPPAGNREGRRGEGQHRTVGAPVGEQVGYERTTAPTGAASTGPQMPVSTWHLFPSSLSPAAFTPGSLSPGACSSRSHITSQLSLFPPSCIFPALSQLQ